MVINFNLPNSNSVIAYSPTVVNIGGEEKAMTVTAQKLRLQMEAQKLADEKTEFVINSKEELEGIMKCTACKRVILQLHSQILGRIAFTDKDSSKKRKKVLKKIINKVCTHETIASTPEIITGCNEFIETHDRLLLEVYLPRATKDDDVFEERFPVTQFCRYETTACPKGIKSLDELLGKKIDEQRASEAATRRGKGKGNKSKKNVKKKKEKKTTKKKDKTIEDMAAELHQSFEKGTNAINENDNIKQKKKKKRKRRKRKKRKKNGNANINIGNDEL